VHGGKTARGGRIAVLPVHRLSVPQPGEYLLGAVGLHPGFDYAQARLELRKPRGMAVATRIAWVLAAALALIAALVLGALRWTGTGAPR